MTTLQSFLILLLLYTMLFVVCFWAARQKSGSLAAVVMANGFWGILHIRHTAGIIITLIAPIVFIPDLPFYLLLVPGEVNNLQVMLFIMAALPCLLLASKEAERSVEKKEKDVQQAIFHIVLRTVFIISYEWFFRGCLLFICINAFGIFSAVAINILLYSLIHSFSSKKELIGSVVFGIVLCAFTIWCKTVWPAIVLHWLLSFSFDSILLHSQFIRTPKFRL